MLYINLWSLTHKGGGASSSQYYFSESSLSVHSVFEDRESLNPFSLRLFFSFFLLWSGKAWSIEGFCFSSQMKMQHPFYIDKHKEAKRNSSMKPKAAVGWLTYLTPSCLRRGSGGDRDPRRWGTRETIPNTTLSPPQWFLHLDGQQWEPF